MFAEPACCTAYIFSKTVALRGTAGSPGPGLMELISASTQPPGADSYILRIVAKRRPWLLRL